MMRWRLAAVILAMAVSAYSQETSGYEVASVKPHAGPVPREGGHLTASGPRLSIACYSVLGLLMYAYDLRIYQIPRRASLDHTMYDVEATAADGRPRKREEFRDLVQALLADRFHLRAHREKNDTPVYALTVGKGGVKFRESSPDAASSPQFRMVGVNTEASFARITMAELVDRIASNAGLDRPVVDQTGLAGSYQLTLTYTPESRRPGANATDSGAIGIFTAVQELGLRLVPRNAPFETLVIDHLEKPSGN